MNKIVIFSGTQERSWPTILAEETKQSNKKNIYFTISCLKRSCLITSIQKVKKLRNW